MVRWKQHPRARGGGESKQAAAGVSKRGSVAVVARGGDGVAHQRAREMSPLRIEPVEELKHRAAHLSRVLLRFWSNVAKVRTSMTMVRWKQHPRARGGGG